jgi:hypothetical protein
MEIINAKLATALDAIKNPAVEKKNTLIYRI